MSSKHLTFGILAVAVLAAAWVIAVQRQPQTEIGSYALLPDFIDRINDIERVAVESSGQSVTITRAGDDWHIAEFDQYPASAGNIRELLVQISELRVVESKTSDPALHGRLGLNDIDAAESRATRVTASAADGPVVNLLIGDARSAGGVDQHYVRRADEDQTYLVDGRLDVRAEPASFTETDLLNIPATRISQVSVRHAGGEPYVVARAEDDTLSLENLPEGRELKSEYELTSLAGTLANLRFEQVRAAASAAVEPSISAEFRTRDGLIARLDSVTLDDEPYAALSFSADPAVAVPAEDPEGPESPAEDGEAGDTGTAANAVGDEAAALNGRTDGWLFRLPEFKMVNLRKDLEDLTDPVADAAAEPEPE